MYLIWKHTKYHIVTVGDFCFEKLCGSMSAEGYIMPMHYQPIIPAWVWLA